jgi:glucokinase
VRTLICDIGGTNVRATVEDPSLADASIVRLQTQALGSSEALAAALHEAFPEAVQRIVFAVAGTVESGPRAWLTNAGFWLEGKAFASLLDGSSRCQSPAPSPAQMVWLNDLEAAGYGARVRPKRALRMAPRPIEAPRPRLVIAPGTGLGVALDADPVGGALGIYPTELGHMLYPFDVTSRDECAFAESLTAELGRTPLVEDVLSGAGLRASRAHRGKAPVLKHQGESHQEINHQEINHQDAARPPDATAGDIAWYTYLFARWLRDLALGFDIVLSGSIPHAHPFEPAIRHWFSLPHRMQAALDRATIWQTEEPEVVLHGAWAVANA